MAVAILLLAAAVFSSCSGGGSGEPQNPWSGTRTTTYILRGDVPDDFRGPDGTDELIQAQIRQALTNRTIELDLYEVENSSGALQSIRLHNANILSYLMPLAEPAFEIPGVVTRAQGIGQLELSLAGPALAWQTLVLESSFDAALVEAGVQRIRPYRHLNPVYGEAIEVVWEITGLNGSRLVQLECRQRYWLYGVSTLVP